MKLKLSKIEDTGRITASGKKSYHVYDEAGTKYSAYGDWFLGQNEIDVKVTEKPGKFGHIFKTIWPLEDSYTPAVSKPVVVSPTAPSAPAVTPAPAPVEQAINKAVKETDDALRQSSIIRQHSQEMAIRFASLFVTALPAGSFTEQLKFTSLLSEYFEAKAKGDEVKSEEVLVAINTLTEEPS